jgi:hypothetical protein
MWQLVAIVLMAVVLFYWLAFCLTVAAWLKAIGHLFGGNFIRAALWLNVGTFMLFWWYDKPHDWDTMMPGVVFFTGLGALATFVRWRKKLQSQTMPTLPTLPKWPTPSGNVVPFIKLKVERKRG